MPTDQSSDRQLSFSPFWLWIGFALILALITQLLSFNGLYGQDSHEYLRYSRYLQDLMAGAETNSTFFYPIAYPLFGSLLGSIFSNVLALQWISVFSLAMSAYCLYRILILIFPKGRMDKVYFVSLVFVLSPFILRASVVVMSDLFALMWVLLALWQFLRYRRQVSTKALTLFALAAGLAFITRYATSVILLLPLLVVVYKIITSRKYAHLPLLVLLLLIGPVLQFYIKGMDPYGLLDHPLLLEWEFENMFSRQFDSHEGFLEYPFINLLYPLSVFIHPGFFVLFLPLLFFFKKEDFNGPVGLLLLGVFAVYAFFLAGIPFQNDRFLLLAFPLILPAFYPAFQRMSHWVQSRKFLNGLGVLIVAILLQLTLAIRAIHPFWAMNQMEQQLAQTVKELEPERKLYTFGWDIALNTYEVDMQLVNLRNEDVREAEAGDYLFFNEAQLKDQWEGRSVMLHYRSLKDTFELIPKKEFRNNWKLYELR